MQQIINYIKQLLGLMQEEIPNTPLPPPAPITITINNDPAKSIQPSPISIQPVSPAPVKNPVLQWNNPEWAHASVMQLCQQAGIDKMILNGENMMTVLMACLWVESGYNTQVIHRNINPTTGALESTDYGICQINDYWHIGAGKDFPSVEYVLANPQACVEWMIQQFIAGKADEWVSYTSSEYKSHL